MDYNSRLVDKFCIWFGGVWGDVGVLGCFLFGSYLLVLGQFVGVLVLVLFVISYVVWIWYFGVLFCLLGKIGLILGFFYAVVMRS